MDQARLDAVRSNLKYGFLSNLSTPSSVAGSLARFIALTGDVTVVDELWSTYEEVTPEDVQRAARLYLTPARSTVTVLHAKGMEIPSRCRPKSRCCCRRPRIPTSRSSSGSRRRLPG